MKKSRYTIFKSITLLGLLFLGFQVDCQINTDLIFEEQAIEEVENKSPEAIKRTEMAMLRRDISMQLSEAWSTNNYQLLEANLSEEIKAESKDLKKLMAEINKSYSNVKLSTMAKNGIFATRYRSKNKKERHILSIRHFFRDHENGYQIFMIISSIQKDGEEVRIDFPAINGEIHKLIHALDYDKFSSVEEQFAWSKEGLVKTEQAFRDSTISRTRFTTFIENLFEASIKMERPTSEIIDFKFMDKRPAYKEILQQYTLISYAEKGEFDKITTYASQMTDYQIKHFRSTAIKEFYRSPTDYNTIAAPYEKIMKLLGKE